MHLFGMLGFLFFLIGFCILLYLSISKIFWDTSHISDRPLFYLGILVLIVGSQLFLTGFLAELVTRNAPQRNVYLIAEKLRVNGQVGE